MEDLEKKQTDEKGFIHEMVNGMKKSNENTTYELVIMNKTLVEKTEKLTWMERKVNKWIKMFEESEQDGASRHNSLIEKINEVDTS